VIIDCDIHNAPASERALERHLPARWKLSATSGLDASIAARRLMLVDRSYLGCDYPRPTPRAARVDAWPPGGGPPASDLDFMREQLLDRYGIACGVLNPLTGAGEELDTQRGAELARAVNDWLVEEWLEREPRLRASIVVAYEDGELAAQEIHRRGEDPRFVQVLMLARTAEPLGRRRYWPIYEAAVDCDLAIGVHFGGWSRGPITSAGFGSFYVEETVGMAASFQEQVASLVCEGVFERFPTLRVVLIEGGLAWLLPLMWRLDRAWKLLAEHTPRLQQLPSQLIREHIYLTTQPIEEPPRESQLAELIEQLGMQEHIMYSSDYPHWDFDAPDRALPRCIGPPLREQIMGTNAQRCYRLGALEVPAAA
jgi:predicted TIM-barrel fold metal-dependent hydrolase